MSQTTHFAFTICSNNYLGQALALKTSFFKYNPNFEFYIVLVDKLSDEVDYTLFEPANILPIADVVGIDLEDLISRYNIIELNTSVKPSVFKHIISTNPNAEVIYYLDPDLYFYDSLSVLNEKLKTKTAVLTPHILSPIPRDGKVPDENIFLQFGIYNLGFIGVNVQSKIAHKMIDWWEERTINYGYDKANTGYFVDQLWMTHAPQFYNNIEVLKTFNYNMAPWNLHERYIVEIDGDKVTLNDSTQLVFYHFSKIAENDIDISREFNRFVLEDFPLLKDLYVDYNNVLKESCFNEYKKIPIGYSVKTNLKNKAIRASFLQKAIKKIGNWIIKFGNKV